MFQIFQQNKNKAKFNMLYIIFSCVVKLQSVQLL